MPKDRYKIEHAITVLSIWLAIGMFAGGLLFSVVAGCCLLMSFSLFFMAAVPAFFIFGGAALFTFGVGFADAVIGIVMHVAAKKNETITRTVSVATSVVDIITIPVNLTAFVFSALIISGEANAAWICIFVFSALAVAASVARFVLGIIRAAMDKSGADKIDNGVAVEQSDDK
ncbi:MAG: hypothetical protein NC184_06520 [Roseburia sp.]|nr:hypothetical protein [Roseburia sp.]